MNRSPLYKWLLFINLSSKRGAEGQSRTDLGPLLSVFEYDALCINQFHHETHSMIGSLVVLTHMVCPVEGVGQAS